MKKIFVIFSFLFINTLPAQKLCEKMLDQNNIFINAASNAVKYQSLLDSDQGIKLQKDFNLQIADLSEKAATYTSLKILMNAIKLRTVVVYSHYLFKTKQFKDLYELSGNTEDVMKQMILYKFELIACEGIGTGNIQGYDEESDSYYTTTGQTTVTKFSFDSKEIERMADQVNNYFAFACYLNNDTKKGDEFFLKTFDNRYFYNGKSSLMKSLAEEILTKYDNKKEIRNIDFAAAVTSIYFYNPSELKTENERKIADLFYQESMSIFKKDNQFSSKIKKGEKLPLSNPTARSEAYQIVLSSLVRHNSTDQKDVIEVMKKLFLAEKETGKSLMRLYDFAKLFYTEKVNNDNLTNAILIDNDPVFMTELSDRLMKHFKEYDSFTASDTIYQVYLFYKKVGENSKAKKAFNTIHEKARRNYKEL